MPCHVVLRSACALSLAALATACSEAPSAQKTATTSARSSVAAAFSSRPTCPGSSVTSRNRVDYVLAEARKLISDAPPYRRQGRTYRFTVANTPVVAVVWLGLPPVGKDRRVSRFRDKATKVCPHPTVVKDSWAVVADYPFVPPVGSRSTVFFVKTTTGWRAYW